MRRMRRVGQNHSAEYRLTAYSALRELGRVRDGDPITVESIID